MNERDIIRLFKKNKPISKKEIERFGLKLSKIGEGVFRNVYKIPTNEVDLVVKIPKDTSSCRAHSRKEMKMISRIQKEKKYKILRRYLPEILYFDQKSGVMLSEYYEYLPQKEGRVIAEMFFNIFRDLGHREGGDIHYNNIRRGIDSEYVLIDLGYF